MKLNVLTNFLWLLLIVGTTSCGKKANDQKNQPDSSNTQVVTQLGQETHKELLAAIIANDFEKFKKLLESKSQIDLNVILDDGETLMTTATRLNRFQMVELLVENNASVYKANSRKETPLMVASKNGFEDLVRLLVSLGSKTDYKDNDGNTALHLSIINKFEAIALYLINSKANIDITNNENQTPLKLAEIYNLKSVLELLRSLTQTNVGLPDKMTVRNLITLGDVPNLNQLFTKYPTLVYEYRDLNFFVLIMHSHSHDKALSMTHLLMNFGADLNGPKDADTTPLIEAVRTGYEDFMNLMLNENVNPNSQDLTGKTALIWAIEKNKPSMVQILMDKNAQKKYTYYVDGNKKKMNACDVARSVKKKASSSEDKKAIQDILNILGCGLRWLF